MSELIHIVYMSFSSRKLSEEELDDFLTLIRKKNKDRGVTGLLLYKDEAFIQLIEGNKATIDDLFTIISKDSRHSNILMLLEEPINKRAFPDWSMGFLRINNNQTKEIPGFSDFMQDNHSRIDYKNCAEAVRHLLYSFREHT